MSQIPPAGPLRLLAFAFLVLSGCAEMFVAPEYRAHVARLEAQARAGDPLAQLDLARLLERGAFNDSTGAAVVGWPRDSTRARALRADASRTLRAHAAAGDAGAMTHLGVLHYNRDGVPADTAEAARLWAEAAQSGNVEAAVLLAMLVERDSPEGVARLRQAAEAGHVGAMSLLVSRYWSGRGVERDTAEAVGWLERAAETGDLRAARSLSAYRTYQSGQ